MRFRIPPLLPPYAVLVLVTAYAAGSLWLGLARLDAITRLSDASAQNAATVHELQGLVASVNEIELGERGFTLTADEYYLEPFERGRRRIPALLATLRDKVRDDSAELALVEDLVPLIAERSTLSAASIERKRSAPDQPFATALDTRDKESSGQIRAIVAALEDREQNQLTQARLQLALTIRETRWGMYILTGLTFVLLASLFFAVRRLRALVPVVPKRMTSGIVDTVPGPDSGAMAAGIGTLLRDAMLRMRLAAAAAPADSGEASHLRSLITSMEGLYGQQAGFEAGLGRSAEDERNTARDLSMLAQSYSSPNGLTVKPTLDHSIAVDDLDKRFLIRRLAEWALEMIMLRKRAGEVTLQFTASGSDVALQIQALTDNPYAPVSLTPKERAEVNVLQRSAANFGGTLVVGDGPTGLLMSLLIPAKP